MAQHDQYAILNNISDSVLVIDQEYTIIFANHHFLELCGLPAQRLVGEKCYHIHHHSPFPCAEKSIPEKECVHKQVFETGLPATVAHQHIMADGSKRFLEISASPIKDDSGAVVRLITIMKDVTAQEELRERFDVTLGEHEAILSNAPFTLSYLDCEMRIIKLNAPMEKLVGHRSEEVKGRHCYDVWGQYAQDDCKKGRERICDACKVQYTLIDGRTYSYERQVEDRYVEVTTSPVRNKDGHIVGSLECGQDITERKRAEETLYAYKRIISTTQDLMSFVDRDYVYQAINDAYCHAHKKKREEIINHSIADLLGQKVFSTTIKDQFDRALSGEQIHYESWFDYAELGRRYMEVTYYPFYGQGGIISGVVANVHDVTERKLAEKALRDSESLYDSLYNNIADAAFIVDLAGHFLDVNQVTVERLGYSRAEFLAMTPEKINTPEYVEGVKARIAEVQEKGNIFFETVHVGKDGRWIPTEISGNIIQYHGKPAILSLARDISERKEAEDALQKSEQRFRLLYERAPLPYQSLDENGSLLDMNQAWLDTLGGYGKEEVVGKFFADFLSPVSRELFESHFSRFKEAGETHGVEFEIIRKDGSHILTLFNGRIGYDQDGNFKQTHCIFQDITAQRQAEDDLKKQKILLETIINTMPDIICLKDGEGRWLLANEYGLELFELHGVDYQGKTDVELAPYSEFYRDVFLTCMDTDNETWAKREPSRGEETIPRPDGTSCVFDIVKIPLFHDDGSRHALVVAGRDITALKQSEDMLRQSKEEWERTFNAMSDIVTIQDKDMRIVRANKAAQDFFEVGYGDLVGKHCYQVFRGISEPCRGCPLLKTIDDIANHSEIIRHDNLGKTFLVSSAAIHDRYGDFQYLVHIAKDITEQKRLEEELFQAHKMEAIGTLASGIAHDFNNILSAIIGYTELAKMELPKDSSVVHDLAEVLQASQRATGLVKQILTFSRKGAHKREKLQPYLIAKEALKLMRASLPTSIEILENIDPESGIIWADPTKIHQIMINLCTNALHAMEEETGTLKVTMRRRLLSADDVAGHPGVSAGPFIELSVGDSGCGMDQQTQQRIFEPYFTTRARGKGTGLGLAVVLGIVQDYGGMITVDSEPGRGTTFDVYFPAIIEEAKRAEEAEEVQPVPTGTERILTVDDEGSIVALQKAVLSRLGYTVTAKTSSEEALAAFKDGSQSFDLLITDQSMPALSGAKLAKEVLGIWPDMPIILCTGYSSTLSEESAMAMGIKKYLMKPVDIKDLARTVREVLDG